MELPAPERLADIAVGIAERQPAAAFPMAELLAAQARPRPRRKARRK